MPRKVTKKLQRTIKPDRKYQSVLVQRLINKSMLDGKKLAAERMVYAALEHAAKNVKSEDPLEVFEKALGNISPSFEVKADALVVQTTRFHSQSRVTVNSTMPLCGSFKLLVLKTACPTKNDCLLRLSMPTTKLVLHSRKKKTRTRWQKPTVPLHTLLADNFPGPTTKL